MRHFNILLMILGQMAPLSGVLAITPPGVAHWDSNLEDRLQQALKDKGENYQARSEHLSSDGSPRFINHLIREDSPYLLQHAHNPVNWYAWSAEAFEKARKENKPIFLSIGYSTCHWCHVMEHESFENIEIARYLNQNFIAIKVDRELHPDVDETYMTAIQLTNGQGGWPSSSFLMPDGKPFHGATYFPPEKFLQLLHRINDLWNERQDELHAQANHLAKAVADINTSKHQAESLDTTLNQATSDSMMSRHDDLQGGFGTAPKFPNETFLLFLLDAAMRDQDHNQLEALTRTLHFMGQGGIYDQIAGGFHRYATDPGWLIPHFEKMLYNQAWLGLVYARAWQLTGNDFFERITRQTLDYVLREMTAPDGGFYSATDADSEGEEGLYFLWTTEQIKTLLTESDAQFIIDLYQLTERGNFEGKNILNLPESLVEFISSNELNAVEFYQRLDGLVKQLWHQREKRIAPLRDDKVITSWNGFMIATLAEASTILSEPRYLSAAEKAADFLWSKHHAPKGKLWRATLNSKATVTGVVQDYASLGNGFLSLYDATQEPHYLERSESIAKTMIEIFHDEQAGGFYTSPAESDVPLIARPKEATDGALPSTNTQALNLLVGLSSRTDDPSYQHLADRTLASFAGAVKQAPMAYASLLQAARLFREGSTNSIQYTAAGSVFVKASLIDDHLSVVLNIKHGWHINSDTPLNKELIPTVLSLKKSTRTLDVDYPPSQLVELDFQDQALSVFEGDVVLQGKLSKSDREDSSFYRVVAVELKLQACNEKACLPPEIITMHVPYH